VLRLVSVAPDLWLLPAGFPSANPAELVETQKVREVLKRMHQGESLVIIDTPPALHSAEAAALAGMGDGIVLVVRSGRSRLRAVREIIAGLRRNKLRLLGMVLVDHRDGNRHTYVWGADDSQAMNDPRILPLESRARRSYPSGGGTRELR
jgi:Mrp family chromosome partitioning ATPase